DAVPRASPGPGGAPVRAGVTLLGSDNVTYRLVRDLAAGCQLQRFDPERRSFSLVSRDLAAVAQYLIEPGGAPPRSRFAAMLSIAAADLPSRRAGTAVQGAFP